MPSELQRKKEHTLSTKVPKKVTWTSCITIQTQTFFFQGFGFRTLNKPGTPSCRKRVMVKISSKEQQYLEEAGHARMQNSAKLQPKFGSKVQDLHPNGLGSRTLNKPGTPSCRKRAIVKISSKEQQYLEQAGHALLPQNDAKRTPDTRVFCRRPLQPHPLSGLYLFCI